MLEFDLRRLAVPATVALLVAACASPDAGQSASAPAPGATTTSRPPAAATAPTPTPAAPEMPAAEAKPAAQRFALQAVDQLQSGDEPGARQNLERALQLDPTNDLAKKLLDQINADAQRELGPTFFRYTVQPGDSLSRIAQQYLGDRFRFWILAKYNDISNPSRLPAGAVIKVPGRAPAVAPPPVATEPPPRPAAAPEPAATELAYALKTGADLEKAGNLEGAYSAYVEIVARYPSSTEAVKGRDTTKAALIRNLDREASVAFQRQNLDLAIAKYNRILELEPANKKAALERERALDLKKRMADKFGGAPK